MRDDEYLWRAGFSLVPFSLAPTVCDAFVPDDARHGLTSCFHTHVCLFVSSKKCSMHELVAVVPFIND